MLKIIMDEDHLVVSFFHLKKPHQRIAVDVYPGDVAEIWEAKETNGY